MKKKAETLDCQRRDAGQDDKQVSAGEQAAAKSA
jgi:hypothetical protein